MSIFRLLLSHSRHASDVYRRLLHVSMHLSHAGTVINESVKHCYAILNVSAACSNDELRTAYLLLVKKYHPDSISGQANADKFALVEDAYRQILVSTCPFVVWGPFSRHLPFVLGNSRYSVGQKNGLHAFRYKSAESEPIWMKSGTV